MLPWVQFAIAVGSGIRGESTVKVTGEVMVSGQQRVMVDTLLVSGHEDQCDVTVTLDAYWLVRSEGKNEGREGGRESKEKEEDKWAVFGPWVSPLWFRADHVGQWSLKGQGGHGIGLDRRTRVTSHWSWPDIDHYDGVRYCRTIRGESNVKVTGEVMVSGQQRVMVDTLLVSGHEDQCDVTVTLDAYWLVRSEAIPSLPSPGSNSLPSLPWSQFPRSLPSLPWVQFPPSLALASVPSLPPFPPLGTVPSLPSLPWVQFPPSLPFPGYSSLPPFPPLGTVPSLPSLPWVQFPPSLPFPGVSSHAPFPPLGAIPSLPSPGLTSHAPSLPPSGHLQLQTGPWATFLNPFLL
ncbi:hypothetical protein Pcinc_017551 [Petrolisthes cinctipes]|uniref:Uncharacterized protein n=1 Tax=Petrolisthes cinctipes TaxID=88211 RepID=A0AAE1FQ35_PETCI|nr:hypothetical protein Pcinc_017551 [Petrolisthes cinctipes]